LPPPPLLLLLLLHNPADDYAPPVAKARWFATFYLCIPTGFAAGYIYGGLVSAALGWRAAFFIESAAIVPFVVFAFVSKPLHLTGSRETGPGGLRWSLQFGLLFCGGMLCFSITRKC
jgi:predicted MFS family arabinose efflux permease